MSQSGSILSSGGGGGGVNSVSGTLNRITSTGGANPVIDISASYVGQTSLTTLGTITTGTWNATAIGAMYGGTGQTTYATGDILYASAPNTLSKLAAGSNTQVLTLAAGVPSWATPTTGTVTSVSGTANRITSTGGATPVIDISASYVGQSSITTLGTVTTGVWNGTAVDVSHGGTGDTTLTNHGVLIGQGTSAVAATAAGSAGQVLQSGGAAADPTYSTATYPSTVATGDVLYGSATNVVSSLSVPSLPGVAVHYDGTTASYFNPLQESYLFDDFISGNGNPLGNMLWNTANTGNITNGPVGTVAGNHPGVVQFSTGAGTTNSCIMRMGSNNNTQWPMLLGGGPITFVWVVMIPVLSSAADIFIVRCGLMDTNNAQNVPDGVYFEYTDPGGGSPTPYWSICTAKSNVRTVSQTNVTVTAGTWYTLRADINAAASSIAYSINGTTANVSPITTNIPTLAVGPAAFILKNGGSTGTTSMAVNFDMFYLYSKFTSSR